MHRILQFFRKYSETFLFVLLQAICIWFIILNNSYQGAFAFNTSNSVVGEILQTSHEFNEYIGLRKVNRELAAENAKLRDQLAKKIILEDSTTTAKTDSSSINKYKFISALVVNNSTSRYKNYVTINKGRLDSVFPGMAVICPKGIVGMVKNVSTHYATVTSVLHTRIFISSKVKKYNASGTVRWEGTDFSKATMLYVPRHVKVMVGDTIVTSGYSSVFPENIPVGIVSRIDIRGDESFYRLSLNLTTDFSSLNYVYVVRNRQQVEQDSIETVTYSAEKQDK